jgi:hypothetical protein
VKKKYVPISGFAFGEKADFAKLERLARQGWILDGISMFFYRLKKEEPQTIVYSLDYRSDCDDEYFAIFQAAGWTHRATLADTHIFSAPEGTTPLYLDAAEQSEQYLPIIRETAKGSAVSFLFLILLGILRHIGSPLTWTSPVFMVLFVLAWVVFVFNFMPCLGYLFRRLRSVRTGR